MQGNADAYRHIRMTKVIEGFSTAYYTLGFTWIGIDIMTHNKNDLNWGLAKTGVVTVGMGFLAKWLAYKQKKKAIRYFNDSIMQAYQKKDMGVKLQGTNNGMGLVWSF